MPVCLKKALWKVLIVQKPLSIAALAMLFGVALRLDFWHAQCDRMSKAVRNGLPFKNVACAIDIFRCTQKAWRADTA